MENEKQWYKSKTIWGAVLSGFAVIVIAVTEYFGVDISQWLETVALIAGIFGVPFTIYGRKTAGTRIK